MSDVTTEGLSLIGDGVVSGGGESFQGVDPATGDELPERFYSATGKELEQAAKLATDAAAALAATSGAQRGKLLRAIADGLVEAGAALVERAHLESGLPLPRLQGELGRTVGQMRLFAEVVEEGSWVDARVDLAEPDRKPLPRADIRSMLRPLGPVAVFGASNFPLAFSVAGGDTASALAGGNPVIVKAHAAHPGTSEIAGKVIRAAVKQCGLPAGVFALLFDGGIALGGALVTHPAVKAVGFTGSASGGQALMKLAAARPEPIPCYAEMGSTNPMFVLPGAMRERAAALAAGLQGSFTLGSGQFCTKPGVVFVPKESAEFLGAIKIGVGAMKPFGMLTHGIAAKYEQGIEERLKGGAAALLAGQETERAESKAALTEAAVFEVSLAQFEQHPELAEEIFGPTTLLVHYGSANDLVSAAKQLQGHLTATIHGTAEDLAEAAELVRALETKVGRILFNGYPTGVEVNHAMVHGGPFPATSDGRSTSVGSAAILRFVRPVCYQDFPDQLLPVELQRANPAGVMRLLNGKLTRDAEA